MLDDPTRLCLQLVPDRRGGSPQMDKHTKALAIRGCPGVKASLVLPKHLPQPGQLLITRAFSWPTQYRQQRTRTPAMAYRVFCCPRGEDNAWRAGISKQPLARATWQSRQPGRYSRHRGRKPRTDRGEPRQGSNSLGKSSPLPEVRRAKATDGSTRAVSRKGKRTAHVDERLVWGGVLPFAQDSPPGRNAV